ncbi:sugar ABC transporter substrate-binding protein [Thioclava dalianensis]|uniref:Sugar ABC transporter substrate-binding protein n=1 Tax=Thioclava dalianensis TaxID=1185766 RepID=A0A074T9J6_9RHOB|nr:substrate-binding domain-containing protein [Thioclava dalianensis]KEP68359.1 sugar ABC transporter substrate-binding protein [Thioclava dalianensis]SFM74080.1 D-xylose transport system substrate-binding protein [Thioclava dalianensis]
MTKRRSYLSASRIVGLAGTSAIALGLCAAAAQAQDIKASDFGADFAAMAKLKDVTAKGKGKIGVLLPDTASSARYTSFDEPYLKKAFEMAGLSSDDLIISNAQGSEADQLTQAQTDISQGATVLLLDPISSGGGAAVEKYAKEHGVAVIDYDRLTVGGDRDYYVSFDNVSVGKLIGKGMEQCLTDWNIQKPQILVMAGSPDDNNATLFKQGYMDVLKPKFDSGDYVNVGEPAGTWDPSVARTTFEQQFTAHQDMNAVVTPNDDNANAVISYLKTLNVPPKSFPTTGQDATVTGLQNVLTGYQCGTVYKPIYLEAQAAAALAIYLRAGETPPESLINGKTMDSSQKKDVPSILMVPIWVTPKNMADTVVKDKFVDVSKLCTGSAADACKSAGIGN